MTLFCAGEIQSWLVYIRVCLFCMCSLLYHSQSFSWVSFEHMNSPHCKKEPDLTHCKSALAAPVTPLTAVRACFIFNSWTSCSGLSWLTTLPCFVLLFFSCVKFECYLDQVWSVEYRVKYGEFYLFYLVFGHIETSIYKALNYCKRSKRQINGLILFDFQNCC